MLGLLERLLREGGVNAWGICRFSDLPPLLPCRAAARLPQKPVSVIALLLPYGSEEFPRRNVARYAVPDDYHVLAMELLRPIAAALEGSFPGERFVPFADISPIPEVVAAQLCGLGAVGKNGLLVRPEEGAYSCIASIVTTARLPASRPFSAGCSGCGRCLSACPTGALTGRGLDKARCRSFITQRRGALSEWEAEQVRRGGLAWGCDLCLDACPHQRAAAAWPGFLRRLDPILTVENLDMLLPRKAYGYRGRAVLERNLAII